MSLASDELALIRAVGFDEEIFRLVKTHSGKSVERLMTTDPHGAQEPAAGLSIAVEGGEEAERLMTALRPHLGSRGYRSFWSERHEPNGLKQTDELAILKTSDPYAMVRLRGSDAGNYDISTDDILSRLKEWEQICSFDVVGASRDWVALQFSRLPENICAFAEEVYRFCPDTVGQGVGLARERDDPERFRAARLLCPHISINPDDRADALDAVESHAPELKEQFRQLLEVLARNSTPTDMGIRLLAYELQSKRYLFLWWD